MSLRSHLVSVMQLKLLATCTFRLICKYVADQRWPSTNTSSETAASTNDAVSHLVDTLLPISLNFTGPTRTPTRTSSPTSARGSSRGSRRSPRGVGVRIGPVEFKLYAAWRMYTPDGMQSSHECNTEYTAATSDD